MTGTTPRWPVVWITGASSGIGEALALRLAAQGSTVAASARSEPALRKLAVAARTLPGRIVLFPADVTDPDAMRTLPYRIEKECGEIGLGIFCAGTYISNAPGDVSAEVFRPQFEVNFMGVIHGLEAILPRMRTRGRGQVAVVASLSGYRGLPHASAYGASKAALINLCEALRLELHDSGVGISLVNPGFVKTPLAEKNSFPMPFLISVEEAARIILKGLQRKRFEIAFPKRLVLLLKLARILPYRLYFRLASKATGV